MPSDVTPEFMRGFGIPTTLETLIKVGDSDALAPAVGDYTEQGPHPGAAVPANTGIDLMLETSGTQAKNSGLDVYTIAAGNPGQTGSAAFVWKNDTDGSEMYRGQDVQTASGWGSVFDASAISLTKTVSLDVEATPLGPVTVAHIEYTGSGNHRQVVSSKYDPDSGAWGSPITLFSQTEDPGTLNAADGFYPTIAIDPDSGDLYCCHWSIDSTTKRAQVVTHRSTDDGASWKEISTRALRKGVDIDTTEAAAAAGVRPGRLRLAITGGQMLLVAAIYRNDTNPDLGIRNGFLQFASNSLGGDFHTIASRSILLPYTEAAFDWDAISFTHQSVSQRDGKFLITWPAKAAQIIAATSCNFIDPALDTLMMVELGNAYDPLDSQIISVVQNNRLAAANPSTGWSTSDPIPAAFAFPGTNGTADVLTGANISSGTQSCYITGGDGSAWVDEAGIIYFVARVLDHLPDEAPVDNFVFMMRSDNSYGGVNAYGSTVGPVFHYVGAGELANVNNSTVKQFTVGADIFSTGSAANYLTNFAGCATKGRQCLITQAVTTPGTWDEDLSSLFLGGYTTVNTGAMTQRPNENERSRWTDSLTGAFRATDIGWTETTTSSGTVVYDGQTITFTTTSGDTAFIHKDFTLANMDEGVQFRCTINPVSGTGGGVDGARELRIEIATVTHSYGIRIVWDLTTIEVLDLADASVVGSSASFTKAIDIIGEIRRAYTAVTVRDATSLTHLTRPDRDYESPFVMLGALTNMGSGGNTRVSVGNMVAPAGLGSTITALSNIHFTNLYTVTPPSLPQTNPAELFGRRYPTRGRKAFVNDGVEIRAIDGVARIGDAYEIQPRFEYPLENIQWSTAPSPRIEWRSEEVAARFDAVPDQDIIYRIGVDGTTYDSDLGSDLLFLTMTNINFQRATIYGYTGGAWVSLGVISNTITVYGDKLGKTFKIDGGAPSTGIYVTENECAGWTLLYDPTSGGIDSAWYEIEGNTAGSLAGTTDTRQAVLFLKGVEATDPDGYNGRCSLWPNSCTALLSMRDNQFEAIKVNIGSTETAHGYIKVGSLTFGRVMVPGRQYSRGRVLSYEPNTPTVITEDGVIRGGRQLGPGGLNLRIAWVDGVDTTDLSGDATEPDYFTAGNSGGEAIAAINDVARSMQGMIRGLGYHHPFVYLPNIPSSALTIRTLSRERDQALFTLTSPIEIESVLGDESVSEVFRVGSINARQVR